MRTETGTPWVERDRLERRVRRMELAIAALRDRAVYRHPVIGTTPPPVHRAIKDFETKLADTRERLNKLGHRDPTGDPTGRMKSPSPLR